MQSPVYRKNRLGLIIYVTDYARLQRQLIFVGKKGQSNN